MNQQTILLLDIGNVVLFASHSLSYDYLKQLGVPRERAEEMYVGNTDYLEFSRGDIDEVTFTESLNWRFGTAFSVAEMRRVHDIHINAVNEPLLDEVRQWNPRQVAIVTDTNPWQTARERELLGTRLMAWAGEFRSHEMRRMKSDAVFFTQVLDQLSVPAEKCLLIDDSPAKLETADKLGIRTYLFQDTTAAVLMLQSLS